MPFATVMRCCCRTDITRCLRRPAIGCITSGRSPALSGNWRCSRIRRTAGCTTPRSNSGSGFGGSGFGVLVLSSGSAHALPDDQDLEPGTLNLNPEPPNAEPEPQPRTPSPEPRTPNSEPRRLLVHPAGEE